MSYYPHGFTKGGIIYAADMNDMDNQIALHDDSIREIASALNGKVDEIILSEDRKYIVFKANGETITEIGPIAGEGGGGGGGGDVTTTVMTVTNTSGWLAKTIAQGTDLSISCTWSSTLDDIPTGAGVLKVYVGGVSRSTRNVDQGSITVNITPYLSSGMNSVRINITDAYGNGRDIRYTVTVANLSISSSFDYLAPVSGAFTYAYVPYGELTKTVHFKVDSTELSTETVETTGRQQNKVIPAQTHGDHTLEVWFVAEIDGAEVESNHLWYNFMSVDSQSSAPVITSQFHNTTAEQYQTIAIPYQVYNPAGLTAQVELIVGSQTVQTITVDRTEQVWSYRPMNYGSETLKIKCGSTVKEFALTVTESPASIGAVTENLALYLTAQGRSNSEAHPETWGHEGINATLSNFTFVRDGWQLDEDNISVLRVSGAARVTIPYKIFEIDRRQTGLTIEIEYATRNVADYSTPVFSCASGGRGLVITPQDALLSSEQTSLDLQFKENEHIRVAYTIGKSSEYRLVTAYIDGAPARNTQYPTDDDFSQVSPVNITIGSDNCTIDIYCIRVYTNDLTADQIRGNWIADTQDVEQMLARYDRNNIYDAYGNIVLEKLPQNLPYLIIECEEMPQYKGDKKTATVTFTDPANPARNWVATGVQINVQGTSSSVYEIKNTDFQMKSGFELPTGHADKWALRGEELSIPTNRFVGKQDVASSESANNTQGTRFYNDLCPYTFAEKEEDSRARWGIDGIQAIEFWRKPNSNALKFMGKINFNFPKRFAAGYGYSDERESWEFQNNTSNLLLFKTDVFDMTPYIDAESGETRPTWRQDYEARFPDDTWQDINKLQEFQTFIVSTCREQATGNALAQSVTYDGVTYTTDTAAYRLAKFKAEFGLRGQLETFLFYYIYTEFFLMVDSRAKNLFIGEKGDAVTLAGSAIERKFCAEPYDMDTQMGINNEGMLGFPYWLEDTDTFDNANVFNGQTSTLWNNIRDAFDAQIRAMYQQLRSKNTNGLNYDEVEGRYETAQAYWPEAIWAEDAKVKYTDPLTNPAPGKQPTAFYLPMNQGSKEQQRKSWLSKRFAYMDSKWNAGDALGQVIQLRGYAKSNITVTPYINLYCSVKYGSYLVQQRGVAGTAYTLTCPIDELNDTEIYIYSAPWIAKVGDLSGLKVGVADFSQAVNIQEIKLGDASSSYENTNMKSLSFGSNKLLRKADVRNCVGLGTKEQKSVDMSGCEILEEAYFEGTSIQGLSLPNGGVLKKLHLPETMTNITILNQKNITEFTCEGYTNVSTLRLENNSNALNVRAILQAIPAATRLRLVGFYWECTDADEIEDLLDIFDTMRGLDEQGNTINIADGGCRTSISGTIHTDSLTGAQIASYQARYPYLTVAADHTTSYRRFMAADNTTVYQTVTCIDGVAQSAAPSVPSKSSTAQYNYTGVGWNTSQNQSTANYDHGAVTLGDMTYYPAYTASVRSYTITFVRASDDGGGTLQTRTLQYGTMASYTGSTPTTTKGDASTYPFLGWNPALATVTGNATYTAKFKNPSSLPDKPTATTADGAYGVEWDYSQTSPQLTRKGLAAAFADPVPATSISGSGSSPFDTIAPWKDMKEVNILSDGTVVEKSDSRFSYTNNDVMVWIPEFYYTAYKDETNSKWLWAISPTPLSGYEKHPGSGQYVSKYHTTGTTDAVGSKSGNTPLVNVSQTNFRTYSHNKGSDWYMLDLAAWSAIQILYLVEFAHFDSQTKLGTGWNTGSISAVGGTDSAAYHTVKASGAHNQYRWIEDPFSNVYDWVDGFAASSRKCYVGASDTGYAGGTSDLTDVGITLPSSNEIKNFGYSDAAFAFLPNESVSNSSYNTYVCDRVGSASGSSVLYVGGFYYSHSSYGLFCFLASYSASGAGSNIGSRLLFK